jgi:formylglycine-generating enzyme required for sulfatase activity
MRQFNVFDKLGLGDTAITGTVRFEVVSGGAVAAYITEIDNRTQDSIFIPAQRADFGDGCSYQLDPGSAHFDSDGGTGSFTVTTESECEWQVTASDTWISITNGGSHTGSATVRYNVASNSGDAREGSIRAGRRTFRINQDEMANEVTIVLPGDVPMDLVYVPPGTFEMGSPTSERGRRSWEDLHEVTLTEGYYLGKTEVTQEQWVALMGSNPSVSNGVGDEYPVFWVSWNEIAGPGGFIEKLNQHLGEAGKAGGGAFRLPTEAEWERAARADTQTRFNFGDGLECPDDSCESCTVFDEHMWWCGNTDNAAQPVGTKPANAFGLHDMHGNVGEWVQDGWKEHLGTDPQTDPLEAGEDERKVTKGGNYYSQPRFNRSAIRHAGYPSSGGRTTGFRIARSVGSR